MQVRGGRKVTHGGWRWEYECFFQVLQKKVHALAQNYTSTPTRCDREIYAAIGIDSETPELFVNFGLGVP